MNKTELIPCIVFAQNERFSPFTLIPFELTRLIFSFFKAAQLDQMRLVCRGFKQIAERDELWKLLLHKDFQNRSEKGRELYLASYKTKQNWRKGRYRLRIIDQGESYWNFLVSEDKIIREGERGCIKIWNLQSGDLVSTLDGHPNCENGITRFFLDGDFLVSLGASEYSAELKMWNKKEGRCLYTLASTFNFHIGRDKIFVRNFSLSPYRRWLEAHNKYDGTLLFTIDECEEFIVAEEYLYTAHSNGVVRISDKQDGSFIKEISSFQRMGHVIALNVRDDLLFIGYSEGIIRAWNRIDGKIVQEFDGQKQGLLSICVQGNYLIGTYREKLLKVWDVKTGVFLYTLDSQLFPVILNGERLISSSFPGIRVSDANTGAFLFKLERHQRSPRCFWLKEEILISSAQEVELWDLSNGTLLFTLDNCSNAQLAGDSLICTHQDGSLRIYDFS